MKKFLHILTIGAGVAAAVSCSGTGSDGPDPQDGRLLKEFMLVMNGLYYHASFDEASMTARVGVIQYGGYVSGVEYLLADGASISPDPADLVGNWPAEQVFTVTRDGETEQWTLSLPAYLSLVPEIDGKEVIFRDEFDEDGPVNPAYWTLVKVGTAAWQQTLAGTDAYSYVEDGNLVLVTALDENGEAKGGAIKSEYKVGVGHDCRISARIKFVNDHESLGQAFWCMPVSTTATYTGWPHGGELDIMEHSYDHDYVQQTIHSYYIDLYDPTNKYAGRPTYAGFNRDQYNVYEMDLLENSIIFYVNGVKTMTYENMHLEDEAVLKQWPFRADYYIIFSFHPHGAKVITEPSYMLVDWVRVVKL